MNKPEEAWDYEIKPRSGLLHVDTGEIWRYRDLLRMFVKRDVVTVYKQTILGPIWYVLQPVMTTIIYVFIFGKVAGLSTDGLPQILFYLSGTVIWNYFSESFTTTAKTFKENENIFGKVYFPRLIMPLSKIVSGLLKFGIQFSLFAAILCYYLLTLDTTLDPNWSYLWLFPVLIGIMAFLGLGFGILFTSLTTKYRDLNFLIAFGVQLLMYATPVIYPLSSVPGQYKALIWYNPISAVMETFRFVFLGAGQFNGAHLIYSILFTTVIFVLGVLVFNRTEKTFMDTV